MSVLLKQHIILSILWMSYCGMHSLLASNWLKTRIKLIMKGHFKYFRLYYSLFAFVSLVWVLLFLVNMRSVFLLKRTVATTFFGSFIGMVGLTVMFICIKKYFTRLSGVKSLLQKEKRSDELMITGIHGYLRHPLYAGTFLFIWGLWLIIPLLSLLITTLIITIYTLIAITWEEQKLEAEFGDSYRRYKQQVPKLIPSLKSK